MRTTLGLVGAFVASLALAVPASAIPPEGAQGAGLQCVRAGGLFFVVAPGVYGCTVATPAARAVCENAFGGTYTTRLAGYPFLAYGCTGANIG